MRNLLKNRAFHGKITMEEFIQRKVKTLEKSEKEQKKEDTKIMKRKIKDSVFTNLFQDKKYLIQLYQALHPEDKAVTEDKLTDVTIENVLTDNIYNDLGFMIGNELLILVEAQSIWTVNIIIRALMYLTQTYHNYLSVSSRVYIKAKKYRYQYLSFM